ncbi:hypothetical protein V1478_013320 [Vespula squamosa]|uniref:Uncharacterized protein n=1 Tax=Vespula squamosa TaxID=30214 RepID=A0ABD2AD42_VESSQ
MRKKKKEKKKEEVARKSRGCRDAGESSRRRLERELEATRSGFEKKEKKEEKEAEEEEEEVERPTYMSFHFVSVTVTSFAVYCISGSFKLSLAVEISETDLRSKRYRLSSRVVAPSAAATEVIAAAAAVGPAVKWIPYSALQ